MRTAAYLCLVALALWAAACGGTPSATQPVTGGGDATLTTGPATARRIYAGRQRHAAADRAANGHPAADHPITGAHRHAPAHVNSNACRNIHSANNRTGRGRALAAGRGERC